MKISKIHFSLNVIVEKCYRKILRRNESSLKTKRYRSRVQIDGNNYSLVFTGSDEGGKSNPYNTDVNIICERKNLTSWSVNYGNVKMPEGAWNGFQNIQTLQKRLFVGLGSHITEIDINNGNVIGRKKLGNTEINQIATDGMSLFLLYSYYKFNQKMYSSNIICVDSSLQMKWYAQLPSLDDIYSNSIRIEDGCLKSGTWGGVECIVDKSTGKLLKTEFTK